MKKTVLFVLAGMLLAGSAYAGWFDTPAQRGTGKAESDQLEANMTRVVADTPIPYVERSLERQNVAKRAQLFNDTEKISYIYFVSFGKVMAFYTVKGKVSSLQSYITPQERVVRANGAKCGLDYESANYCFIVSAPDIDGTYGNNPAGIFFFTTEGAYVEWTGEYMVSDQPLKLSTQPELVRQVK